MSNTVDQVVALSLSQKIRRLGERLHQAQWRRYGLVLLAGKVLGVAAVMLVATFITELCFTTVLAADAPVVNIAWIEIPAADGGPRGSKGVAEAPNVATAAAIGNAIAKIAGRRVTRLPMSAERVWSVMNS